MRQIQTATSCRSQTKTKFIKPKTPTTLTAETASTDSIRVEHVSESDREVLTITETRTESNYNPIYSPSPLSYRPLPAPSVPSPAPVGQIVPSSLMLAEILESRSQSAQACHVFYSPAHTRSPSILKEKTIRRLLEVREENYHARFRNRQIQGPPLSSRNARSKPER